MKLDIFQVDAFSNGPFTGNPASVVPLSVWLPDTTMQQIAEENNLSETAFFVPEGDGYYIRWFTPLVEVALCGHATLASAFVIFNEIGHDSDTINFNCQSGPISVYRDAELFRLDFPSDNLEELSEIPDKIEKALGNKPLKVMKGRHDLLCIFNQESEIINMQPDFALISKYPVRGVIVTAPGNSSFDFVSRGFFPQTGINEDPATGSAHTSLTPYWSKKLNKKKMKACQLSNRKGFFQVQDEGARTLISGSATLFLKGEIYI